MDGLFLSTSWNQVVEHLRKRMGLNLETVGETTLRMAILSRLETLSLPSSSINHYWSYLQKHEEEWQELIEKVVVNETWFMRDAQPFVFLKKYAQKHWRKISKENKVKILCLPCATGEEAYSIAITLLEAGLDPTCFHIDGVDISQQAVKKAARAIYKAHSFRHNSPAFQVKYFQPFGEGKWRLKASIAQCVSFTQGNLLTFLQQKACGAYDVFFSRNLLIYFDQKAREHALTVFRNVLRPNGLLFVGHAEMLSEFREYFTPLPEPSTFAWQYRKDLPVSLKLLPTSSFLTTPSYQASSVSSSHSLPSTPQAKKEPEQEISFFSLKQKKDKPKAKNLDLASLLQQVEKQANAGAYLQALELVNQCIDDAPNNSTARYLCAMIHQATGDLSCAEKYFRQTLYLNPHHIEAITQLTLLLQSQGKKQEAQQLQKRLLRETPPA